MNSQEDEIRRVREKHVRNEREIVIKKVESR